MKILHEFFVLKLYAVSIEFRFDLYDRDLDFRRNFCNFSPWEKEKYYLFLRIWIFLFYRLNFRKYKICGISNPFGEILRLKYLICHFRYRNVRTFSIPRNDLCTKYFSASLNKFSLSLSDYFSRVKIKKEKNSYCGNKFPFLSLSLFYIQNSK